MRLAILILAFQYQRRCLCIKPQFFQVYTIVWVIISATNHFRLHIRKPRRKMQTYKPWAHLFQLFEH